MTPKIPLARPNITEAEIEAVVAVLRTPQLSLGPKVPAFEEAMARYCGVKHAVACSSGTAGLHLIVRSMGIGPGDEVITTPFSFVASANCVLMEGARPVFVDIHPDYWDIDAARIQSAITPRTKAILPVDVFGQIADMAAVRAIANRHGLKVIEDSCEALGTEMGGRRAGSFGDAGCFGFYPNKQITTGEGGMVITDDDRIADLCRSMRNQGRDPGSGWLAHPRLGYNYRMSDINAALGLAQLSRIDEIKRHRQRVYDLYRDRLHGDTRLVMQKVRATLGHVPEPRAEFIPTSSGTPAKVRAGEPPTSVGADARIRRHAAGTRTPPQGGTVWPSGLGRGNAAGRPAPVAASPKLESQDVHWFVFVVRLADDYSPQRRDEILRSLTDQGIGCSNYFAPIHLQKFYMDRFGHKQGDFPICESIAARTLALPFHHELTEAQIDAVSGMVMDLL